MPVSDSRTGSIYICLVSAVLLLSIIAGGTLLIAYVIVPTAKHWLAIAGVALVCFPWFFWLLTFLYRIFSHFCCGPRSSAVVSDAGGRGDGSRRGSFSTTGANANGVDTGSPAGSNASMYGMKKNVAAAEGGGRKGDVDSESPGNSPGGGAKRVHFGGAMVVDNRLLPERGSCDGEARNATNASSRLTSTLSSAGKQDDSFSSHDSEIPLRLSMAS